MTLDTAQQYSIQIVNWLQRHCERIEVAGSVRRGLAHCNDIDVVCIPKAEVEKDMLGAVVGEKNLLWEFLNQYVADGHARFRSGGNIAGKFCILELRKCQCDVFFASPENFASRLLCRTGSKDHNIWLASRAIEKGFDGWRPYEGLERGGKIQYYQTEQAIYEALGLEFIEPKNRELPWIKKRLEFGL